MKHPFHQKKIKGRIIREFDADVDSNELVWHRDHADRYVKVRHGHGWQLQMENSLPIPLVSGKTYYIPKNSYHRVLKGDERLVVEIREEMKVTKQQLRQIIREAISLDIEKDDIILTGKFKNKRSVVKDIGTDKNGHPTINGKSILKFKIEKLLPEDEWSKKSQEALEFIEQID